VWETILSPGLRRPKDVKFGTGTRMMCPLGFLEKVILIVATLAKRPKATKMSTFFSTCYLRN